MSIPELAYELAQHGLRAVAGLAGALNEKLRAGLLGKAEALGIMERWAVDGRDRARPLVWLHAPSVGEALMAQAIIAELRAAKPDIQIAFTHFSPSAERTAERVGADVHAHLPWDTSRDVQRALDALMPSCIAFVRTELWPTLTRTAARSGVRLAMVNAILPEASSRLRAPARLALRSAYSRLDAVGAVSGEDSERFARLGVRADRVRITGDARFDQVVARVAAPQHPELVTLTRRTDALNIVAGSTWKSDERELLRALARHARGIAVHAIIAPHEPTEPHLAALERAADAVGLSHVRLAQAEASAGIDADLTLVDRTGVLADLYAAGDVALVGGGFHSAGLHSVIEPAALGLPVLYGPRIEKSAEAGALARAGGAFIVHSSDDIVACLSRLTDASARTEAGMRAHAFVQDRLGGAKRNAQLILDLLNNSV
jgi:3-deoxy-D-manno-octulosonic-acid transferase